MTNCLKAVAFSLIAHGLAAVALAFWFSHTTSVELPSLDLSAVELSFAVEEREAPAAPPPPPEPDTTQPILPRDDPISRESAPQAPKQAQIDAQPRPLKSIRPDYPVAARKRGAEGEVTLELEINERGRVSSVKVVESCGHDDLDAAAVRAAAKAQFVPAKAGKNAVSSVARITISFRLTAR